MKAAKITKQKNDDIPRPVTVDEISLCSESIWYIDVVSNAGMLPKS